MTFSITATVYLLQPLYVSKLHTPVSGVCASELERAPEELVMFSSQLQRNPD